MSREKQIEGIIEAMGKSCASCFGYGEAELIYNAGYRKKIENMVEVVRCAECQESEACFDTLLWCNEWDRLVSPKGFCHCGAKTRKEDGGK